MKIFKVIGFLLSAIIIATIGFGIYSFVNHQKISSTEKEILEGFNTGSNITIDGISLNYKIFNPTNTENTIVFMGGSGVTDLSLSLLPLSQQLNAKIVLINRPGYGNSKDTYKKADIEYIVKLYREALRELGIYEKVILMPHSISGMYAMYWASIYSDEVESIIGLDIGSPYLYLEAEDDYSIYLTFLAAKIGLQRQTWLLDLIGFQGAIINYNVYDESYFDAIVSMNNINPFSFFNLNEERSIKVNAQKTIDNLTSNYHSMHKLFIQSNSISGTFYDQYIYKDITKHFKNPEALEEYKKNTITYLNREKESLTTDENTTFVTVEGPHCLYYYPTEELINTINDFIDN